jgi:hypothetical protein
VVYNFGQVSNAILIAFDKPIYNGKVYLLLRFDEMLNRWIDDEDIYKDNPVLFGQILNKLHKPLKKNNVRFQS